MYVPSVMRSSCHFGNPGFNLPGTVPQDSPKMKTKIEFFLYFDFKSSDRFHILHVVERITLVKSTGAESRYTLL